MPLDLRAGNKAYYDVDLVSVTKDDKNMVIIDRDESDSYKKFDSNKLERTSLS